MKQRPDLRQLPPRPDRLQAHAAEPQPLIVDLVVQHMILDDVELVAEARRIASDHIGELVDDRIEQRHRGGKLSAAIDRTPCQLDRAQRLAPGGDHQLRRDRKVHPQEIVALLHELLMQVGQNADDLLVEDIEADMLVGIEQGLARDIGQRRNPGEPVVAATVGQIEMQPQPAVRIGEFRIEVGDVELRCGAVAREAIGGDDADIGEGWSIR